MAAATFAVSAIQQALNETVREMGLFSLKSSKQSVAIFCDGAARIHCHSKLVTYVRCAAVTLMTSTTPWLTHTTLIAPYAYCACAIANMMFN
jgi:hypothetical protein